MSHSHSKQPVPIYSISNCDEIEGTYFDCLLVYNTSFCYCLKTYLCARLELRYIMGISRRKIIIGKKKSSTMYTFSYFRKMASISPFFLCSSKRLSKWSSLTFGFAWLNFQGPNKPFKHKLKFPLEPWGQTLNHAAIDFLSTFSHQHHEK